jgi:sigma-E factor negative regulatory protein RseC
LADPRAGADDGSLDGSLVEGFARVVSVDGDTAWLEPEPMGGCGGCSSVSACGSLHASGSRLAARRFPLAQAGTLRVGERVVVGIPGGALLRASATAFAVPLLSMLGAGIAANAMGGGDMAAAAATLAGLVFGLGVTRLGAGQLSARGDLSPRLLRRLPASATAPAGAACHPPS